MNSSESDSTPPEVLDVWFDNVVVDAGGKNVIRVDARDDGSGVKSIMGACQSPSGSALIWFNGVLDPESGIWAGEIALPKDADCGNWVVQQLSVSDKGGNTTLLKTEAPALANASFQVSFRAGCDSIAPTLEEYDLADPRLSETATEFS